MTRIGNDEAFLKLKSLLEGTTIVEEEVMGRVVQALVRLSGKPGEELFADHLRRSKISHMASRLASMSVMVLGANAVPVLVAGAVTTVDLGRIRATTEVLAKLGTVEAHRALHEIALKVRHPVGKELALSKKEELERDHPTRFVLLPRLNDLDNEDPNKLLADFISTEDRNMSRSLLEELPKLDDRAMALACTVLGRKGDLTTARILQGRLVNDMSEPMLGHFSGALREIIGRIPMAVEDFTGEWAAFWGKHSSSEKCAVAAAEALSVNPDPALLQVYREFLSSPFESVRLCGYRAAFAAKLFDLEKEVSRGLASSSTAEISAAAAALAALGNPKPLEELAKSGSSKRRSIACEACLKVGRRDLWCSLALDEERFVRQEAITALERSNAESRPTPEELEPIISFLLDPDLFATLCRILNAIGDQATVVRLLSRMGEDETLHPPIFATLKALRQRGIYRWENLGESGKQLLGAILKHLPDPSTIALVGSLVEDFDMEALEKLRDEFLSRRSSMRQGAAQAVTMAVIGRIHILGTKRKVINEIEAAFAEKPANAREQIDGVNRVASLWMRTDIEFDPGFEARIENWLVQVAMDKIVARIARKAAVDALGKAGTVNALPSLMRLVGSPTEEIASAAEGAVESLARRHPSANISLEGQDSQKRQTILVVEDDPNTRSIFQTFLFQRGYAALGAGDGDEALSMMGTAHVDMVLLDLQMPNMDGFEFMRELGGTRNPPPVIVITSHGDRTTVMNVLKLGAVDFLKKPIDLPEMLSRVKKLIGRSATTF